ncbi:MAG: HD domain-containing protein [Candidatus Pacearchaeota archaeon]|nr:HD domain-containing protein [Candidatus Pacearchaeota archaeon]
MLEVVKQGLWLCQFYPEADRQVVEYGCWLHDVVHPCVGYEKEDHNIASAVLAREFLRSIDFDKTKLEKVIHCIEAHRTSRGPDPETIEAKIVFSADNLSHFTQFDYLVERKNLEFALKKVKRDIAHPFMLPEALERAKKLSLEIEKKFNVKIL